MYWFPHCFEEKKIHSGEVKIQVNRYLVYAYATRTFCHSHVITDVLRKCFRTLKNALFTKTYTIMMTTLFALQMFVVAILREPYRCQKAMELFSLS